MKELREPLSEIMLNYANLCLANGKQELAEHLYTDSLKQNPSNFKSYFSRGTLYRQRNDFNAALVDMEKALETCPPELERFFTNTLQQVEREQQDQCTHTNRHVFFAQPLQKLPARQINRQATGESLLKYVLLTNQQRANVQISNSMQPPQTPGLLYSRLG